MRSCYTTIPGLVRVKRSQIIAYITVFVEMYNFASRKVMLFFSDYFTCCISLVYNNCFPFNRKSLYKQFVNLNLITKIRYKSSYYQSTNDWADNTLRNIQFPTIFWTAMFAHHWDDNQNLMITKKHFQITLLHFSFIQNL